MNRSRKEKEKRIKSRAMKIFNQFKRDKDKFNNNIIISIKYPISVDDFGNNFDEDFYVYIKFCHMIQETFGENIYYMWISQEGTHVGEFEKYYNKLTKVPIGEKSNSGNLRKGVYYFVGIMPMEQAEKMIKEL